MNDLHVVNLERAGEIYRAMNGDAEAQKVVTLQDVAGLQNAPTFERFLLWNKEYLEIIDLPAEVRRQA
jgi:hypothetical protein